MIGSTHASEFITGTMGLVLRIERRKLGSIAKSIFDGVELGNAIVYVPALVFAEILSLSEKQRISLSLGAVTDYLKQSQATKNIR